MSEYIEPEFSEEFLREVDAAEATALQSRGICHHHQPLACSTPATTHVDFNDTIRPNTLAASADTPAYVVQAPTSGGRLEGHSYTGRESQPGRRLNSIGDAGCNGDRNGYDSVSGRREDYLKTGDNVTYDGDTDVFTYRWKVDRISVRDCTGRAEEVVGQGELMVNAQKDVDGALVMLNAVVTAAGGGRAICVPREAIVFLANGSAQTTTATPEVSTPATLPTLLLGLGIGHTIVMGGIFRSPPNDDCHSYERDHIPNGLAVGGDVKSLQASTPERRRLAPLDFPTPFPIGENREALADKAGVVGGLADEGSARRAGLNPIIERLIDAHGPSLENENRAFRSSETDGLGSQRFDARPSIEGNTPDGEGRLSEDSEETRSTNAAHAQGDAGGIERPPLENPEPNDPVQTEGDGGAEAGRVNESTRESVVAVKMMDIPDHEWRRPLVPSPPNRRRAAAGRRRPTVRDIPCGGPIVLALGDCGLDSHQRNLTSANLREIVGPVARGVGRKRPRITGSGDTDEERSNKAPLPRPPAAGRRKKVDDSWLSRRRTLHRRYQEFLENGVAEETAAESSRRAEAGRPSGGVCGGEVLFPGLRVFRRQEQAFAYADALRARLARHDAAFYKVLSFETNSTGSRKFLVCDFRRFEEHYPYVARADRDIVQQLTGKPRASQGDPHGQAAVADDAPRADNAASSLVPEGKGSENHLNSRGSSAVVGTPTHTSSPLQHVYEIIRERSPCRMYFDLEFTRGFNEGLDGEAVVQTWINVVAGKLQKDFDISVGRSNFLDLDSSTPRKFSRHLILHLPGDQLFEDNSHIGRFVNSIAADLEPLKPLPSTPISPSPSPAKLEDEPLYYTPSTGGNAPLMITEYSRSSGDRPAPEHASLATPPLQSQADLPLFFRPERADADDINGTVRSVAAGSGAAFGDEGVSDAVVDAAALGLDGARRVGDKTNAEQAGARGEREEAGALERLWVCDGDGRRVLFADVSVYTRNRCFRLVGSSKFGKTAALRVAKTNQRTLEHMEWRDGRRREPREVARTVLHDSLVVPAAARRPDGETLLTVEGGRGPHRYSRFGVNRRVSQAGVRSGAGDTRQRVSWQPASAVDSKKAGVDQEGEDGGGVGWRVTDSGFGSSPFPAVDDFLRTLICRGGVTGHLRQWSYTARESPKHETGSGGGNDEVKDSVREKCDGSVQTVTRLLTHQVANNRWCCNIGRAHKSNHIFLVTDLSRGEVRQHCHDQDCRRVRYRSPPVRLPSPAAPSLDDLEGYELELGLAVAMAESPAEWAAVA